VQPYDAQHTEARTHVVCGVAPTRVAGTDLRGARFMVDAGRMIWRGCYTLRHDGIHETDYLDQMTIPLFWKMSSELGPSKSNKELLNQVEADLMGALEDVRCLAKATIP